MFNPTVESGNKLKDITEKFHAGFDIGVIAFLFIKSRFYTIAFFLLSFAAAFIYLRYSQPEYESRAVVQISDASGAESILNISNPMETGNPLAEAVEQIR